MKTEQANGYKSIVQGRLITLSQWDGSAFKASEERGEGRAVTKEPDTEGTAPTAT